MNYLKTKSINKTKVGPEIGRLSLLLGADFF